jgi:hypothetical protein
MFNDICTVPCIERDTADDDLTVLAFVFRPNAMGYMLGSSAVLEIFLASSSAQSAKRGTPLLMSFLIFNFFFFFFKNALNFPTP